MMPADKRTAFPAFVHSLKVGMVYGDKEGTLVIKFRPEGTTVEDINPLVGNDQAVMVALVPIIENNNLDRQDNETRTTKGRQRKPQGATEGNA